ncbi:MAG: TolC family protein [Deinococcales bacterium]|jgi:outer membrane protein TolC
MRHGDASGPIARALRLGLSLLLLASVSGAAVFAQSVAAPLGFSEALTLARRGPTVQTAELALQSAQAARDASFATVTGSLQGGYSQSWSDVSGSTAQRGGLEPFSLTATFNVVPFGPGFEARLDAERDVANARMALTDAERQAIIDTARAYLGTLRAQQQLELDRQAVDQATAVLTHVQAQRASGDATDAQVQDASLALEQARTTLATRRLTLQAGLAELSDLVGAAVASVDGEPPASHDPDGGTADDASTRRSDVQQAQLALDAARRGYAAGVRAVLPSARASADLQGGDGRTTWRAGIAYGTSTFQPTLQASLTPGDATTGDTSSTLDGTRFALSLSFDVPLDTSLGASLEAARLAVTSAERALARTRDQASLALAAAVRTLDTDRLTAELSASQRERARAKADEAQRRFDLGLLAWPDLEQARLDAAGADLDALRAGDAVLLDRLELARALGLDPLEVF